MDTGAVAPSFMGAGRGWGLVAKKDIGGNETALSIPKSLWMTYETAMESPVGAFCEGQAPWVALALHLLHEKNVMVGTSTGSMWEAYIKTLPRTLDAPLFWTSPQLEELAGTQLLAGAYTRPLFSST